MTISHKQYQERVQILSGLLERYIDDRYDRSSSPHEREETTLLTIAIRKPFQEKITTFLRDVLHCNVSFREQKAEASHILLLDICLDTDRFHQGNLPHLTSAFEEIVMPKYLLLDFDDVFGGEVRGPSDEDIVLETYDCGSVRVLVNGYQTIQYLNELTEVLGYEIAFYSEHCQKDQALLLRNLQAACTRYGVKCPKVHDAMAVCEGHQKQLFESSSIAQELEKLVRDARQKKEEAVASITDAPVFLPPATSASQRFFLPAGNSKEASLENALRESSLANEQHLEIQAMIGRLEKRIQSCWPYPHKERKQQKVAALEKLIEYCTTMRVAAAVAKVEEDFPSIQQGKVYALLHGLSNTVVPIDCQTKIP